MMKTVEAIKNGQAVTTEELFELINICNITYLSLFKSGEQILGMEINQCEYDYDEYEFYQDCLENNKYVVEADDIISTNAVWNEEENLVIIICQMKNDMVLQMVILSPENNLKVTEAERFYKADVYEVKDFLDDVLNDKNEWYILSARVTNVFGFDLNMINPCCTFIDDSHEYDWKLHISNNLTTLEIPETENYVNSFYIKEDETSKEIIVKPYGQSFTEIKLFCLQKKQ